MIKVMVFGTFDIFHLGHRNFFEQARGHGDYLIVVVARDETVKAIKKRNARNNEQERLNKICESGLADEVVLGSLENKYESIEKYQPDAICLGYDQEFFVQELEEKLKELGLNETKIVRLESFEPQIYKSSLIAKKGFI